MIRMSGFVLNAQGKATASTGNKLAKYERETALRFSGLAPGDEPMVLITLAEPTGITLSCYTSEREVFEVETEVAATMEANLAELNETGADAQEVAGKFRMWMS